MPSLHTSFYFTADNFRPYVTSFQGNNCTDYINAVFVDVSTRVKYFPEDNKSSLRLIDVVQNRTHFLFKRYKRQSQKRKVKIYHQFLFILKRIVWMKERFLYLKLEVF